MISRIKELEAENRQLKKMYAEERLKPELRKEALEKKWYSRVSGVNWHKQP